MRVKLYIGSVFLGIAAIVITAAACTASGAAAEDQPPKSGEELGRFQTFCRCPN